MKTHKINMRRTFLISALITLVVLPFVVITQAPAYVEGLDISLEEGEITLKEIIDQLILNKGSKLDGIQLNDINGIVYNKTNHKNISFKKKPINRETELNR